MTMQYHALTIDMKWCDAWLLHQELYFQKLLLSWIFLIYPKLTEQEWKYKFFLNVGIKVANKITHKIKRNRMIIDGALLTNIMA